LNVTTQEPILYLSLHFKTHRQLYYDLLQEVRLKGGWERWCEFFLDGVTEMASQASVDAKKIIDLLDRDSARINEIGKSAGSALKIHSYLLKKPYLSLTKAAKELDLSVPAMTKTVMKLVEIGMLKERTGQARNRLFAYTEYLAILSAGTEPIK
jgi:Fic family protein